MGELFRTATAPLGERWSFWPETVGNRLAPVEINPRHAELAAGLSCSTLGALRIRDVVGGDHVYTRDHHIVPLAHGYMRPAPIPRRSAARSHVRDRSSQRAQAAAPPAASAPPDQQMGVAHHV